MAEQYGAGQEAWHHWSMTLGLTEHLLPVVSNPGATISPDSKVQLLGKTPSHYNFRREAAGIAKWTERVVTPREIGKWELEPDYGICVQSRQGGLRAIDIDVPSVPKSRAIVETIEQALPVHFFTHRRTREGTGKMLLPFRFEGVMPKAVLQVDGGMVEILGEGQQWIAEGAYLVVDNRNKTTNLQKASGRYLWPGGRPPSLDAIPLLTEADLVSLRDALEMLHGKGEWKIARARREGKLVSTAPREGGDPVSNWLLLNWELRDEGREGELFIRCPFDAEHTSDSGPTETVYYPAGTGGYERGHFKCLHAHCMERTDDDYLQALGYSIAEEFPLVEVDPDAEVEKGEGPPAPRYIVDKQGRKENRAYNHKLFLMQPDCGKRIAWDDFSAQIIWCPANDKPGEERWTLFNDEHYVQLVEQMDRNGFVPQSPSTIRGAVLEVAMKSRVDLAVAWVQRLPEWDGVERVETFWSQYAGAADTEYTRAVGRYSWTAQAGRVLDAGCQVDMVPILVSEQGKRKSSLIAAIAPSREMFTEINLMDRDDDTSRKMRGVLVVELDELRGLKGRAIEDVKAFITRREEKWTPKYLEFAKSFKRRFVFYGSTNTDNFLGDPTGERRYLPMQVGLDGQLDVEGVARDREQLWAEAVVRWQEHGIEWQEAERLAHDEHELYKGHDDWEPLVRAWLMADDPLEGGRPVDREFTGAEALVGIGLRGIGIENKHTQRIGAVLKALGFKNQYTRQGRKYRLVEPRKLGETL